MKSRVKALSLPLSGMATAGVAGHQHQPVGRLSREPSVMHLRPSRKRMGAVAAAEPEARAAVLGAGYGVRGCSPRWAAGAGARASELIRTDAGRSRT